MTFIFWTNRLPPIQSHPNLVEHLEVLVDDSDLNPYHTIPWQKPWCGTWHHWNPSFCSQVTARRIPVPLPMAPKKSAMMVSMPRYQSIPMSIRLWRLVGWSELPIFQLPYLKTKTSGALKLSFQPFYIILVAIKLWNFFHKKKTTFSEIQDGLKLCSESLFNLHFLVSFARFNGTTFWRSATHCVSPPMHMPPKAAAVGMYISRTFNLGPLRCKKNLQKFGMSSALEKKERKESSAGTSNLLSAESCPWPSLWSEFPCKDSSRWPTIFSIKSISWSTNFLDFYWKWRFRPFHSPPFFPNFCKQIYKKRGHVLL